MASLTYTLEARTTHFPASAGTLPIWRIPRLRYRLTEKAQEFG